MMKSASMRSDMPSQMHAQTCAGVRGIARWKRRAQHGAGLRKTLHARSDGTSSRPQNRVQIVYAIPDLRIAMSEWV